MPDQHPLALYRGVSGLCLPRSAISWTLEIIRIEIPRNIEIMLIRYIEEVIS